MQQRITSVWSALPVSPHGRRVRVDPRTFDGMIQRLSQTLSRRSLVGGSLGAAVLGAVGLGEKSQARKKGRANARKKGASNAKVKSEDKLNIGERCDPPKTRHGKKHG